MKTLGKLTVSSLVGLVVFGVMLFVPAGTVHYWQAWVFLVVFTLSTSIPNVYLLRTNPAALDRRMRAGPLAESRTVQKVIAFFASLSLIAMIVVSTLDHRFGWSKVPPAISVVGDVLVAIGLGMAMLVVVQNGYAAANIAVETEQKVVSTGLYGLVRHPMYAASLIMMVGIPLALGSYWGLAVLIAAPIVLALRISDEENLLKQELDGYREYTQHVRYRLVPGIW